MRTRPLISASSHAEGGLPIVPLMDGRLLAPSNTHPETPHPPLHVQSIVGLSHPRSLAHASGNFHFFF